MDPPRDQIGYNGATRRMQEVTLPPPNDLILYFGNGVSEQKKIGCPLELVLR